MNDAQKAAVKCLRRKLKHAINYELLKGFLLARDAVGLGLCLTIEAENSRMKKRTVRLLDQLTKIDAGWRLLHDYLRFLNQNELSIALSEVAAAEMTKAGDAVDISFVQLADGLRYSRKKLIGSGAFGSVYEGRFQNENTHVVAIKILRSIEDENGEEKARKLIEFSHENILKMLSVRRVFDPPQIALVMEKGDTSLAQALRVESIDDATKFSIAKDITRGLQYLHGLKVAHRDVKPDNVILFNGVTEACIAKLTDLDFAHQLQASRTITNRSRGTTRYMAPELLYGQGIRQPAEYGVSVDIYALGMTLYELFTGQSVFVGLEIDNDWALMYQVCFENRRPKFPANLQYGVMRELIERCWVTQPGERPVAGAVYERVCKWERLGLMIPRSTPRSIHGDSACLVGTCGESEH